MDALNSSNLLTYRVADGFYAAQNIIQHKNPFRAAVRKGSFYCALYFTEYGAHEDLPAYSGEAGYRLCALAHAHVT